ncbi:MAG TPA: DUF3306 domain-containing protein [Pseudolabrys sp.]|nr:DUF3306 domain-containing protein [Pseudolabrys sp.]
MSEDRRILSRWSQRKAAARRGEAPAEPIERTAPDAITPVDDALSVEQEHAADETPAVPPIEELTAQSDYTAFLGEKVPEHLRRAALRKLWSSDPVFANLDGLNHYDEDYNLVDTTISAAQTAYRVGRGYLEEIEDTLEKVENVVGAPRAGQIESTSFSVAEGYDAPPVNRKGAGDKSVNAPQQGTPPSVPSEPHEKADK